MGEPFITDAVESERAPGARRACANCGASRLGQYCHACGARDLAERDLSIRHFAARALEEATNLQHSKLIRTVSALLFRPGLLTAEYFSERRVRYVKPLALTLAVLALHLFVYSSGKTAAMYDIGQWVTTQEEMAGESSATVAMVKADIANEAAKRGGKREVVEQEINDKWARNFSLSQIPLIVVFALVLWLVHRSARRYLAEHVIFSMHLISFTGLTVVMMWPLYFLFGATAAPAAIVMAIGKFAVDLLWIVLATRRFYRYSLKRSLLVGLGAYLGYYLVFLSLHQLTMYMAIRSALAG